MGTPGLISPTDLADLRLPYDVYHHLLLERSLRQTHGEARPDLLHFKSGEHPVRHIAYLSIPAGHYETSKPVYFSPSEVKWHKLVHDCDIPRQYNSGSQVRMVISCRKYPLMDVPMSLPRLVTGIRGLFQRYRSILPSICLSRFKKANVPSGLEGGVSSARSSFPQS